MQQLKAVSDSYADSIVDAAHKVRGGSYTQLKALEQIAKARETVKAQWKGYTDTKMSGDEAALAKKAEAAMPVADAATDKLVAILNSGDMAALADFNDHGLYPAIDPVTGVISDLVDLQMKVAREDGEAAARAAKSALEQRDGRHRRHRRGDAGLRQPCGDQPGANLLLRDRRRHAQAGRRRQRRRDPLR